MKVEYRGPHKAVEVPLSDGSAVVVRRGEVVDVPEEIGLGLVVQHNSWKAGSVQAEEPAEETATKARKAGKDGK